MRQTWMEQALEDLAARRAAPPAGINGPQPTGPVGGFGLERVNRWQAEIQNGPERGKALLSAYGKYLKRTGRTQDPVMDNQRMTQHGRIMSVQEQTPATLGSPVINRSNNERRGLTFIPVTLADGSRLHIYYTPDGHRYAIHLKPAGRAGGSTGGVQAPR